MSEAIVRASEDSAQVAIQDVLDSFQELPTIPEVLVRIWQLTDDPRSGSKDLERLVSLEPPLAAKVLRLANSPYFGWKGRIQDIRSAITLLGFDVLRNLTVCLSVAKELTAARQKGGELDSRALWRHSVATAITARELARRLGGIDPESMFTAGVLHDIGMLVIGLGRPEAYVEVVRSSRAKRDLVELERRALGYDHAQLGAAFAERWNFPDRLVHLIRRHHEPAQAQDDPGLLLLSLADGVAVTIVPSRPLAGVEGPSLDPLVFAALGISPDWLEQHHEALCEHVVAAEEFMNLV